MVNLSKLALAICSFILLGGGGGSVEAHMKMSTPASRNMLDVNYGLKAASSICGGYPVSASPVATYSAGSAISVKLEGSASHNGGGCAFSISQDAGKSFQILQVTDENCPKVTEFKVPLPSDLKGGNAIFSFSWIPVDSGAPEYYHDCADIKIVAAAATGNKVNVPDVKLPFYNMPGLTTFWYNNADRSKTLAWVNTDPKLLQFKSLMGNSGSSSTASKVSSQLKPTTTVAPTKTKPSSNAYHSAPATKAVDPVYSSTTLSVVPTTTTKASNGNGNAYKSKKGSKSKRSNRSKKASKSKRSNKAKGSSKDKKNNSKANKYNGESTQLAKTVTVPPKCATNLKY